MNATPLLWVVSLVALSAHAQTEAQLSAPPMVASGPRVLRTVEGVERFEYRARLGVPDGFHLVSRPRIGMVAGGASLFAAGYLSTVLTSTTLTHEPELMIPLAGPMISMVQFWGQNVIGKSGWTALGMGTLAVFYSCLTLVQTAAQVAGLVLVIVGVAKPEQWLEKKPAVTVSLAPGAGGAMGASLVGTF